jgi:hypothetical protein
VKVDLATATLVWEGEVSATVTCPCGAVTEADVVVYYGVVECARCHRIWILDRTVACALMVGVTQQELFANPVVPIEIEPITFTLSPEVIATGALLREAYRTARALDDLEGGAAANVDWKRLAADLRGAADQLEAALGGEEET